MNELPRFVKMELTTNGRRKNEDDLGQVQLPGDVFATTGFEGDTKLMAEGF